MTSFIGRGGVVDVSSYDVLLVGGGGAGLRAAIAVAEFDPKLRVAVVSKVYPMRSHTVSAEGGAAGVIADDDSLDEHAYDTVSGSDWLCDQDAVELFVEQAPKELLQLLLYRILDSQMNSGMPLFIYKDRIHKICGGISIGFNDIYSYLKCTNGHYFKLETSQIEEEGILCPECEEMEEESDDCDDIITVHI